MHARSFIVLLAPMHLAMAGIIVVLFRIMLNLTGSVSEMMASFEATAASSGAVSGGGINAGSALGTMSMFTNFPENRMGSFVVIILAIITVSNIIAARIVGGGDRYMFYFYAALFCTLTGLILLIAPVGVNLFFSPEGLSYLEQSGAGALGMYLL